MIEVLSETELDQLKATNDVLLVYFAPPTCSVGESLVDKVNATIKERQIAAASVDTSANPAIAGQHLVLAFPTIITFVYGREFDRLSRIFSMSEVEHTLDQAAEAVGDA